MKHYYETLYRIHLLIKINISIEIYISILSNIDPYIKYYLRENRKTRIPNRNAYTKVNRIKRKRKQNRIEQNRIQTLLNIYKFLKEEIEYRRNRHNIEEIDL